MDRLCPNCPERADDYDGPGCGWHIYASAHNAALLERCPILAEQAAVSASAE